MSLCEFNALTETAAAEFAKFWCGSTRWADAIAAGRPYANTTEILSAAGQAWSKRSEDDALEAFAAHPLIGDVALLRSRFATQPAQPHLDTENSAAAAPNKQGAAAPNKQGAAAPNKQGAAAHNEQGQVLAATEHTLTQLAELNLSYSQRHGFTFIVCATGKSADEMLAILQRRINNSTLEELATAAAEQAQITRLRLAQTITDFTSQG